MGACVPGRPALLVCRHAGLAWVVVRILLGVATLAAACSGTAAAAPQRFDPPPRGSLPVGAETLSHGLLQDVSVYRPPQTPRSFVIFLSGEEGWRLGVVEMARRLARRGALVAGVDTPRFIQALSATKVGCAYPEGDLDNLSHFVQAYYRLPTYLRPILMGYSSGASLAYASLAQSKPDVFAGLLALGFEPRLRMARPLCQDNALKLRGTTTGPVLAFRRASTGPGPLEILQGSQDTAFSAGAGAAFFARLPRARLTPLPEVGHGFTKPARWVPQYLLAFDRLKGVARAESLPLPPGALDGLPTQEFTLAGAGGSKTFAVLMSGDGGWGGLEQGLTTALRAHGIPVIGMDTLRYFWTPRTPDGTAADTDRIIRYYLRRWNKQSVLLLGYSQGADVLPFIVNRLPSATRQHVLLGGLMGLGQRAAFEFRLRPPADKNELVGLPILPELQRLQNLPVLCIYGNGESDSLCPRLDPQRVRLAHFKGGHDAGGDPRLLSGAILQAAGLAY